MKKKDEGVLISALKKLMRTTGKKIVKSLIQPPEYHSIEVVKIIHGDFKEFEEELLDSDSKIGIIIGPRGRGKTSFGLKLAENLATKTKKNFYSMGFSQEKMPNWITDVQEINYIKNNSIVIIDEGGIMFSARDSMSKTNKLLSKLILISRHKNLSIIFISQNSANLDINIIRQADFIVFKKFSLLQSSFERKEIKDIYEECDDDFEMFRHMKYISYVYSDEFVGFVNNPLPSFWKENISKSFRNK